MKMPFDELADRLVKYLNKTEKLRRRVFVTIGVMKIMLAALIGIMLLLGGETHDVTEVMNHFTIGALILYAAWLEWELEKSKNGR